MKRIITAIVVLPLLYFSIMGLGHVFFAFLASVVAALGLWEFSSMYGSKGILKSVGMVLGAAAVMSFFLLGPAGLSVVFMLSFILIAVLRLFSKGGAASSLSDIGPVLVGMIYIPGLLSTQVALRYEGPEWVIFLYGTVWASDSLALFMGRTIGKRKLYPEISPNKTVAGAVGSFTGGVIGAVVLKVLLLNSVTYSFAVLTGLILGTATVVGDLIESMFKRDAGVKDSGVIFPGHGGLLDKIDGSLLAGPALLLLLKPGGFI